MLTILEEKPQNLHRAIKASCVKHKGKVGGWDYHKESGHLAFSKRREMKSHPDNSQIHTHIHIREYIHISIHIIMKHKVWTVSEWCVAHKVYRGLKMLAVIPE